MSPEGEDATTDTPLDFDQHLNSATEHRTSFCEKIDPIVARIVAGSWGSQFGLRMKTPLTPAASAVRMIVPRFPGDSIDSTASQSEFLVARSCSNGNHLCLRTAPIPCG